MRQMLSHERPGIRIFMIEEPRRRIRPDLGPKGALRKLPNESGSVLVLVGDASKRQLAGASKGINGIREVLDHEAFRGDGSA